MAREIQVKDVLIGVAVLLTVVIVIIRSGNYPIIPVTDTELRFRSFLENMFLFKPRFKEFLFGHPLLILGLWSRSRILLILGLAGQVSIINTFLHLHTPLDISLIRTFYGFVLGSALGLILIILYRKYSVYLFPKQAK